MRKKIHVFVLRLVTTPEEPERLRGAVRSLADEEEHPFVSGASLLDILHRMNTPGETHLVHDPIEAAEE